MKFSIESILGIAFVGLWMLGYLAEAFLKGREKAKQGQRPPGPRREDRETGKQRPGVQAERRPAPPVARSPTAAPTARPPTPAGRPMRPPRTDSDAERHAGQHRRPPVSARPGPPVKPQPERAPPPPPQDEPLSRPRPRKSSEERGRRAAPPKAQPARDQTAAGFPVEVPAPDDWVWDRPRSGQPQRGPSQAPTVRRRPTSGLAMILGLPEGERQALRRAVLASEILAPPLALREPREF